MQQISAFQKAGKLAWRVAAKGKRILFPSKDYIVFRGSVLPRPESRLNGEDQRDDACFLDSSIKEAARIIAKLGCTQRHVLVDIGCGQGRLPIGLVRQLPGLRYLGLDVSEGCIEWCKSHIESRYPSYRFQHVDVVNARYNPSGSALVSDFRLPVSDGAADIVYMWGVVTNMEPEHLAAYANETARILRDGGRLFLTANVEDNVPEVSINPQNYTAFACQGPLHIVRYERQYFLNVFRRAGLELTDFTYHGAGNCQSELYFSK
jgi:SAM-dependent methyltransferase